MIFTGQKVTTGLGESNGSLPPGLWLSHMCADSLVIGLNCSPNAHINYRPIIMKVEAQCYRTATFIKSCLESDSPTLSGVAPYGVHYGCINSHLGWNAFFCCFRYHVSDILSITRHLVLCYVESRISAQLKSFGAASAQVTVYLRWVFSCSFCLHLKLMSLLSECPQHWKSWTSEEQLIIVTIFTHFHRVGQKK